MKKLLVIVAGTLILVLLGLSFIPIKTKVLGYCDPSYLVKQRYSLIHGEEAEYNQLFTGDTTGLMCSRGDIRVKLYFF